MKLARRLLSLLLALLMIFSLAACGGGGDSTDVGGGEGGGGKQPSKDQGGSGNSNSDSNVGTDPGVSDDFVMPERPVDEMSGKEYIIIQHEPETDPFGYVQDTQMSLDAADRISEVEDLYGCTIAFKQIPYAAGFVTQMQALRFAENGGDLFFAGRYSMQITQCIGDGGDNSLLQDLLAVDDIINFWDTNKWGSIAAREPFMAGGNFYSVVPNLWVNCTPLPYYQLVYNKRLVQNAGLTDPQEYWENDSWDREAMKEIIVESTDEAAGVWGINASIGHMVRATFLATGLDIANIDKINADGTVEWTNGLKTPEAIDAFNWLKNNVAQNRKCFNNGSLKHTGTGWGGYDQFLEGLCTMVISRPMTIFDYIVTESKDPFGLTVWAGVEPNVLSGYYEQVPNTSIPVFAQNIKHSAFLMADLFEGLGDVETVQDVLDYYGDMYFDTELDLVMLSRFEGNVEFFFYPNPDSTVHNLVWGELENNLLSSTVSGIIERYGDTVNYIIETYVLPNKVSIENWREVKHFSH